MYLPFDQIDFDARIWVYQANRELTQEETGGLVESLKAALEEWVAHGKPLTASGKVFYNRFVVIAVDESKELPSGCSIDTSVHWLQELGARLSVDFFDRSVTWLDAAGKVHSVALNEVQRVIANEEITPATLVFDNLVSTKAQWMSRWKIPAGKSWLKRYLDKQYS